MATRAKTLKQEGSKTAGVVAVVVAQPARSRPPIELFPSMSTFEKNLFLQQNRLSARAPQRAARVVVVKAADKASVSFRFESRGGGRARASENEKSRKNKRRPQTKEKGVANDGSMFSIEKKKKLQVLSDVRAIISEQLGTELVKVRFLQKEGR